MTEAKSCLIIIDMQRDFCAQGGWIDQLCEDYSNTARVIPAIQQVLAGARSVGMPVFHTREGHLPDLTDLPENKQWRTRGHGLGIGDQGAEGRILVRGETGWNIVPELEPIDGEIIIDKPGKSSFWRTDLDIHLRDLGIDTLYVGGVTTDCCVQSTIRDAFDRGFCSFLITDCVAAVETCNHDAHIAMLTQGRVRFATAITSAECTESWEAGRASD